MTLRGLIDGVEIGNEAAAKLNARKAYPDHAPDMGRALNGSLDAAKRLHDALLPGWHWEICSDDESQAAIVWESGKPSREFSGERGEDRNMARAFLIAILRALEGEP